MRGDDELRSFVTDAESDRDGTEPKGAGGKDGVAAGLDSALPCEEPSLVILGGNRRFIPNPGFLGEADSKGTEIVDTLGVETLGEGVLIGTTPLKQAFNSRRKKKKKKLLTFAECASRPWECSC